MDTEYLVLVNEEDQEQGQAEKWEVHKKGLLHRAFSILVFNSNNEILLHKRANGKYHSGGLWTNTCCGHPRPGEGLIEAANRRLMEEMGFETSLHEVFSFIYKSQVTEELTEYEYDHVFFGRYDNAPVLNIQEASEWKYMSIESVKKDAIQNPDNYSVWFKIILEKIDPYLVKIPYLGVKTISRQFRYKKPQEYQLSSASSSLYNSKICAAVKAKLRQREGSASKPACLDFGAVKYYLASHFGFCLGVANAIDIAYEAIATYPEKKVYMLSELIHNSFVNEDLKRRGLNYLQSEKGTPLKDEQGRLLWDLISKEDIVIIPAFGATNEDKAKLIARGINITEFDATCRLVENVWTRAKIYGEKGFSIVIHGKHEHEETKASFSNSKVYGPTLVVRDLNEAEVLGKVILEEDSSLFYQHFDGKYSEGFDPLKDLSKLAVVNQTTLLASETLAIADFLRDILIKKYGEENLAHHFGESNKDKLGNTLCYATNVNQEAARMMLEEDADYAIIIGGHNSSNTSQLYKLAEEKFGEKAYYIESEQDILSKEAISHFDFKNKKVVTRSFLTEELKPVKIMITAGASCPDGIIHQVVIKINSFFEAGQIKDVDEVLAEFTEAF